MAQSVAVLPSKRSPFHPNVSFSRLLISLRLLFRLKTQLESPDVSSRTANAPDQLESFPPEVDRPLPIDPGAVCDHLVDLMCHLQSLLPGSCEWLEQGALELVGEYPVDAGGVADVWVGRMSDRKVAIKAYRCYSSSNYLSTYVVSGACL